MSNSLDTFIDKLEKLSMPIRIAIFAALIILPLAAVIYLDYYPKHQEIKKLETELTDLQSQLKKIKKTASMLAEFKRKVKEAEADFEVARRALPENEEMPALLTNISNSAQDSGLEVLLFRPGKEKRAKNDFVANIRIKMKVRGSYHQLAHFFDKVSRLKRIVHMKNFALGNRKGSNNLLSMNCDAETFKFVKVMPKQQKKGR